MALSTTQYGYIIDPMVPFTDDKGKTIKDGYVRVFVAGSSTPVITYRNFDGAANQDLIELDNSGRTKTSVIGSKGLTYKVCVYDKDHSQESPILTVDKVYVIGANITAGSGSTVVTGLDGLRTKPDGFVDASVVGTDGYVAIDHTLVTDDLDTDAKVTAVEDDRYIPLLNDDVNDPDSKMTLGRLWQWVLGKIKSLSTTITSFRSGDYIPVDGPSGTAKMSKDDLIAQVRGDIVAPLFRTNRTYYPDMVCIKDGISYVCIAEHTGAWDANNFVAKGVSSFLEDAVKFCQANILSIPSINIPKISISSDGVITITFPETTGQGVDSNAFYVFKGNARSLKMDYSSNLSSGKYEVTLNNNQALVYNYRTNAFQILITYKKQYNGNIYLICANNNGRIIGPLSDYYYNSVAERLDVVLDTSSRYKSFVNVGQVLLDGSVGDVQDWNRYSDFIAVKKGDIVIAHTCTGNGSSAIAFYTSADFSTFVCGVAGVFTRPFNDYVFICPSDGYVVSSTSKYALSSGLNGYVDILKNRKGITFQNPEVPRFDLLNYSHLTKQGVVLDIGESGDYDDKFVESPSIFYEPSLQKLVMLYTAYKDVDSSMVACIAYATSDDGISWTKQGIFWERTNVVGTPDRGGVTGPVMVKDGGDYYLFYIGLSNAGYEGGNKTICCAVGKSLSDFTGGTATRKGAQIRPNGTGWYGKAVWHTSFIHKDDIWYCFFNATASSPSYERIGVACSKSLDGPWSVVSVNLLGYINDEDTTRRQKAIDPSVVKVGSYYIMAYGAGNAEGKMQDNWAYTTDEDFPYGWKFGGVGVIPSETYDINFAHKPFLLCIENKIYHYYTALNNSNHRCIALIK